MTSESDMIVTHQVSQGIRDCAALRKQIVQVQLETHDASNEETWSDPINEQYKVIFEGIRHVEE